VSERMLGKLNKSFFFNILIISGDFPVSRLTPSGLLYRKDSEFIRYPFALLYPQIIARFKMFFTTIL
jgi:hypothetical protein